jgi:hypothetical protein
MSVLDLAIHGSASLSPSGPCGSFAGHPITLVLSLLLTPGRCHSSLISWALTQIWDQ